MNNCLRIKVLWKAFMMIFMLIFQKGARLINLTENEKRMVYQGESICQVAILNEITINKRYAPNPENRKKFPIKAANTL